MESLWDTIKNIMDNNDEYDAFRSRTKEFMARKAISVMGFSKSAGFGKSQFERFLNRGHRGLSFVNISKIIAFMDKYNSN